MPDDSEYHRRPYNVSDVLLYLINCRIIIIIITINFTECKSENYNKKKTCALCNNCASSASVHATRCHSESATKARFPFKRNRLRCVNKNRKKRKRLRWQAFHATNESASQ